MFRTGLPCSYLSGLAQSTWPRPDNIPLFHINSDHLLLVCAIVVTLFQGCGLSVCRSTARGDDQPVLLDSTQTAFYTFFESTRNNSRYVGHFGDESNAVDCIGRPTDKLTTKLAHLFDISFN